MSKLNPPYIEPIVRAISSDTVIIPFTDNMAISKGDYDGMYLWLKTIQSNTEIVKDLEGIINSDSNEATFDVSETPLTIGQYYKVQIAYKTKNQEEIGYYSTTGTIKRTGEPTVSIASLNQYSSNPNIFSYVGEYKNSEDPTEKEWQYRFVVYDAVVVNGAVSETNTILEDSGWKYHYDSQGGIDTYSIKHDEDHMYIQYQVSTINGLVAASPTYHIVKESGNNLNIELNVVNNYENGYIKVNISSGTFPSTLKKVNVYKKVVNTNVWSYLGTVDANPATFIFKDFDVVQGFSYVYAVQAVGYKKKESNPIEAQFEDMFLADQERQLKIKFNPKINGFKDVISEQKVDTLGSKYPIFIRNGNVKYKQIQLSGLISYWMDDEQLFTSLSEIGLYDESDPTVYTAQGFPVYDNEGHVVQVDENNGLPQRPQVRSGTKDSSIPSIKYKVKTTDLVDYNITAERLFRDKVSEWLVNGKEKLFKSPTEGNYNVILTDVSLTPNETLGRMLYSFSATAYEVNYDDE